MTIPSNIVMNIQTFFVFFESGKKSDPQQRSEHEPKSELFLSRKRDWMMPGSGRHHLTESEQQVAGKNKGEKSARDVYGIGEVCDVKFKAAETVLTSQN
jgi:hypothetical protein